MNTDEEYIKRCCQLAYNGLGKTYPNPLVGCVIVKNGEIIGEGWHKKAGGPHAEVDALENLTPGMSAEASTVYVNLEPCSHYGKTPPCAERLVREKVSKVVICNTDPNPLVCGRGITLLQNAGIEVISGVLENEGKELNKRFFHFHEKKRPYIIVKWAESANGYIAAENAQVSISDELHRFEVHRWRSEEAAILVGSQTALVDNPALNVRFWTGKQPLRIVIDRKAKLPKSLKVFQKQQPTLFVSEQKMEDTDCLTYNMRDWGWTHQMMDELYRRNIQSVLVEGGRQVIEAFDSEGLIDEIRRYINKDIRIHNGIKAPTISDCQ